MKGRMRERRERRKYERLMKGKAKRYRERLENYGEKRNEGIA